MNQHILSLVLIGCGGVAPLFFLASLHPDENRRGGVDGFRMPAGALRAGSALYHATVYETSFTYLNTFTLSFHIDALSAFFLMTIFAVCLLATIYSFHYMSDPRRGLRTAAQYLFFSLLTASMALVVTAHNMIAFMLAWEIMSLSSFFLVVHNFEAAENRRAGYLYFVFSQVGAMFIVAAFGVIYSHTGDFGFQGAANLSEAARMLVFVLAFIGFGSKAGVFPFHVWLPHAHPAAPSHISAVMSGVMIKCGIYGIARIYTILGWHTPVFGYIIVIAGMVSGILGVVYALGQHDIKRLLAYHSVENIGIILIGIGIGMLGVAAGKPIMAVLGFGGGLLHVLNHAVFKSLLFIGRRHGAPQDRHRCHRYPGRFDQTHAHHRDHLSNRFVGHFRTAAL